MNADTELAVSNRFALGPHVYRRLLEMDQSDLLDFYSKAFPNAHVLHHRILESQVPSQPNYLTSHASFYNHLILLGRRVVPSESLTSAPNSIIQAFFGMTRYVGQVVKIIGHTQP